jgi:hypothetical protein
MNSTIRQHLEDNPYPRAETPGDCLWCSLVIAVKHYCGRGEHSDQILSRTYGSDDRTKKLLQVLTRSASVPANTLTSGWAAQLVNSAIGEFFAAHAPHFRNDTTFAGGGFRILVTSSATHWNASSDRVDQIDQQPQDHAQQDPGIALATQALPRPS